MRSKALVCGEKGPSAQKRGLLDPRPAALGGVETCLCGLSHLPRPRDSGPLQTICEESPVLARGSQSGVGPRVFRAHSASAQTLGPVCLLTWLSPAHPVEDWLPVVRGQGSVRGQPSVLPGHKAACVLPVGLGSPASPPGTRAQQARQCASQGAPPASVPARMDGAGPG